MLTGTMPTEAAALIKITKTGFVLVTDRPGKYHLTYARTGLVVEVEKDRIARYLTTMTHAFPAMPDSISMPDGRQFRLINGEYAEVPAA